MLQQEVGVDFWLEPVQGRAVDIRVAPEQVDLLCQLNQMILQRVEYSLYTGRRLAQVLQPLRVGS